MENKKRLPIGIQTFEKLRKRNCVYVDKTKYLVDLIDNFTICFLARPRRFGKSLTISTFDALFSGKKELFKGLYAEDFLNRSDFTPYPVIWLDMSKVITNRGIEEIENSIVKQVRDIAIRLDVSLSDCVSPGSLLDDLIIKTARQYDQEVVILLDEYDKPYTDFVNDPEMAEKVRCVLRNFYVQIKANDEYIRFTFITGISKFAKLGVFSTLNTPHDISMMPEYAEICGLTEDEIAQYFPEHLENIAKYLKISLEKFKAEMRDYYNGFSFDNNAQSRLYNPFSTLEFFENKIFLNYWINTGKSKIIADYMKNRNLTAEQFRNMQVSSDFARSPGDMDTTPPEGFLLQSGYLTLRPGKTDDLSLDYPNIEVLNSMSELVTKNILHGKDEDFTYCRSDLLEAFKLSDYQMFVAVLNRLLASIPYDDFAKAAERSVYKKRYNYPAREWLYRTSILSFLRGCGLLVFAELHTSMGRPDLVVVHRSKTWVIELKVAYENQSPAQKAEEALQQIIENKYAESYPNAVGIGLAIDDALRQITEVRITE